MLSRTADHLFWMSRYIERAENLARLLDVTWQMSLVPQPAPRRTKANQSPHAVVAQRIWSIGRAARSGWP